MSHKRATSGRQSSHLPVAAGGIGDAPPPAAPSATGGGEQTLDYTIVKHIMYDFCMELTGGQALARQLVIEGITDIFGIPGVQLDFAMDGLAEVRDQLTFRNTRHEQATTYMADGFARSSGRVGVSMVVPGPGVLNAMAALSTAWACSSPVLFLAGQIPSTAIGLGRGLLHEIPDQSGVIAGLTKWSALALSPAEVPGLVHEALAQLRSGRPRPVALEVPPDVLNAKDEISLVHEAAVPRPLEPDEAEVDRAVKLLSEARHPVICAGWGVQAAGATGELRRLAEVLGGLRDAEEVLQFQHDTVTTILADVWSTLPNGGRDASRR